MAKTQAERSREYRRNLRARATREGVTDDSPTVDQARVVARQALAVARGMLRDPKTGKTSATVDDANTATLAAERALKISKACDELIPVEAVARWRGACEEFGRRLTGLARTSAEQVARETDPAACQRILDEQFVGLLRDLEAVVAEAGPNG